LDISSGRKLELIQKYLENYRGTYHQTGGEVSSHLMIPLYSFVRGPLSSRKEKRIINLGIINLLNLNKIK